MSSHAILIDEIAELKRQVADWHKLADERSAALCTSRAEVERLEKALREAYVKLSDGIRDAEDEVGDPGGECDPLAEAANDAYNILNAALSAQPAPDAAHPLAQEMLEAAASTGHEGTIRLAAQLAGVPPCPKCGFVKQHCKCKSAPEKPALERCPKCFAPRVAPEYRLCGMCPHDFGEPAPEKPALYPECPECGGTSWELDTSGSVTRHCADCGAEIQPFSADELARSEKVVKRVMLTITPCGYGCKDGKNGREIWINEACPTHSRAVGFNDAIGGESICKPAPDKPAEPAGGGT